MEGTRVNHLEEDSKVKWHGLVSQTALNGRRGTVVGMRNKQGRWPVVLDPDTSAGANVVAGHGLAEGARVDHTAPLLHPRTQGVHTERLRSHTSDPCTPARPSRRDVPARPTPPTP